MDRACAGGAGRGLTLRLGDRGPGHGDLSDRLGQQVRGDHQVRSSFRAARDDPHRRLRQNRHPDSQRAPGGGHSRGQRSHRRGGALLGSGTGGHQHPPPGGGSGRCLTRSSCGERRPRARRTRRHRVGGRTPGTRWQPPLGRPARPERAGRRHGQPRHEPHCGRGQRSSVRRDRRPRRAAPRGSPGHLRPAPAGGVHRDAHR